MNCCTFIIPTMGRSTLAIAVESLEKQTNPNWKAIVAFDGNYSINYTTSNTKVQVLQANVGGHAGLIRNFAIELVDTDWIAFLDDDDWLSTSYTEKLQAYSNSQPQLDLIIFTYKDVINGNVVPNPKQKEIESCKVGISFAVRTDFIKNNNIRFTPFAIEDFRFLNECKNAGAKYLITHSLQYYVGGRGGWLRKD